MILLKLFLLNYFTIFIVCQYSDQCEHSIYESCTHQSEFTAEELETARVWLQNKMLEADIKPRGKPCETLYVRKDFKCMSNRERLEFIRVIRVLYEKGIMDRFAGIHARYWAEVHKTAQLGPWHRWFVNELEKQMRIINPKITIPYYNAQLDASRPEKSMVWRYLGQHGVHNTGFCVTDGPLYGKLDLNWCVKRQWGPNGTIPAIDGLELNTIWLQLSPSFLIANFIQSGLHFNTHLAFGGYRGDMSVDTAPIDIQFYLWHNYQMNIMMLKFQLQDRRYLTPLDYRTVPNVNQETGLLESVDLGVDQLIYYKTPVVDVFHVGYGDLCSVPDQIVSAINQVVRNETIVPLAVKRMPFLVKFKLFPKFLSKNFSPFVHSFEEVGNCNRECRPIPQFQPYVSTQNGKRQLARYYYDENFNVKPVLIASQAFHSLAIKYMNALGYCSPYVTS